jgi:guanyl-specific ribonuclease Sa
MQPLQNWMRLAVIAILLVVFLYSAWQKQAAESSKGSSAGDTAQQRTNPPSGETDGTERGSAPEARPLPDAVAHEGKGQTRTRIANQTIRNEEGKVVFRGEVDVGPTLDRIERGEKLRFPNDGTAFQNRERRLPRQPAGYYKEHVHPTPGLRGPGPQRIVTGENGEIYYTPDHYRTFQRLDRP